MTNLLVLNFLRHSCYTSVFINAYKCATILEWHFIDYILKNHEKNEAPRAYFMCQIVD